ncbi:MAG: DUF4351 domain-containing protein [Magnetococcus sp. DMHC-1]
MDVGHGHCCHRAAGFEDVAGIKRGGTIKHAGLLKLSIAFERIMVGLWRLLMKGALDIDIPEIEGITPEYVSGLGKEWLDWLVDATPDEDLAAMPKFGRLLVQSRQEGEASTLLRILRRRFSDLPAWVESRVHAANLDTLDAWVDRAIDARSLQDVFGDETTGRTI